MAMTNAEKQKQYRERIKNGNRPVFKYETNAQKQAAYRMRHHGELADKRLLLKREVLTHYGNGSCACVECAEDRLPCLTIDHVNGGGREHRKSVGGEGVMFYAWLKRNKYPDGFKTLCMNCQWVKRFDNKEYNHLSNREVTPIL